MGQGEQTEVTTACMIPLFLPAVTAPFNLARHSPLPCLPVNFFFFLVSSGLV